MAAPADYDRAAELRALDSTFAGVHGLVAAGATHVPRIFRVPDPPSSQQQPPQEPTTTPSVPVIDLAGPDRAATVASVRRAAAEWGFFQVTGHGVPSRSTAAALGAVRGFHEAPGGEGSDKARLHSREPGRAVKYHCNFDLHQSPVANWRDTLYLRMAPDPPLAADLPEPCRDALFEYAEQLISNDGFRSVEHRVVLADAEPRVSIACFFSTHFHPASTRAYGPIGELVSDGSPALYRETLVRDYVKQYYAIGLDAKTALSVFRL